MAILATLFVAFVGFWLMYCQGFEDGKNDSNFDDNEYWK